MARIVLPIAGAVVGSFFGAPQIGFAIGGILGGIVDPLKINGPGIGDLQVQTGRENVPRAIIYGTAAVAGNLIYSGTPQVIKKKSSGKGAPKVTTTTQTLTFAIRVAEGPIGGIIRIWEDEALVYDKRSAPDIPAADTAKFAAGINIHLGGEDQLPDAAIEAEVGVDLAPYHRGSAYVVFVNKDLTDRGGRIPQYRFEVSTAIGEIENTINWTVVNQANPGTSSIPALGVSGRHIFRPAGFGGDNAGARSDDYGNTWVGTAITTSIGTSPNSTFATPQFVNGRWGFVNDSGIVVVEDAIDSTLFAEISSNYVGGQPRASFFDGSTVWIYTSGFKIFSTQNWISWTDHGFTLGSTLTSVITNVAHGNGVTVGVSANQDAIFVSGDNILFVKSADATSLGLGATASFSGVTFDGVGRFVVAVGTDTVAHVYFTSIDGVSWANGGFADATVIPGFVVPVIQSNDKYFYAVKTESPAKVMRTAAQKTRVQFGDPVPLPAIVADISDRAQVTADKIDVSLLTGTVDGFSLGGFFTASAALEPLRGGHFFDAGEWDGKIHFVPRGGDSVVTITADDLVEDPEETRRGQAMEFPRKLHLEYQNSTIAYAPTKHTAERISPDVRVTGEVRTSTPEVMVSDEAARRATIMQKLAWIEAAGEVTFAVADNFSWLTPSDVITLSARGKSRRLRIEKTELADGIMRLTCKPDRASTYQSTATGSVILPPRPPASTNPGVTVWHWLNIPALTDSADLLGGYFAAAGASEGWAGALLQRSTDAGASYTDTVTSDGAIIGTLLDPLPFAPAEFTDYDNVIRVTLVNPADELESIMYEQMLMERNAIAIGRPGAWEVMQFQKAVQESPGVWALSTLLRGRLNTTPLNHSADDAFVELSGVSFVTNPISQIGVSLTHRGVGINASPEAATVMTEAYSPPRTQYEWAPEALSGTIVGSTLSAAWIPRHRFGTPVNPVPSINFAGYRVTVTGTGGTVEKDTATPSADIDISGLSAPITLSVAMLNRITGPGEAAQLEVA